MNKNVIVKVTNCPVIFGNFFKPKKERQQINTNIKISDLNKKIGAFAIYINDIPLAEELLGFAHNNNLTVAGFSKFRSNRTVKGLEHGDFLTVALSDKYDIDYKINRTGSKELEGIKTYKLRRDLCEIQDALVDIINKKAYLESKPRPKRRTYRELAVANLDNKVQAKVVKQPEKKYRTDYIPTVEVWPYFYQVNNKIYQKNPTDVLVYW